MRLRAWFSLVIAALALAAAGGSTGWTQVDTRDAPAPSAFAITSVNLLPMTAGEPVLPDQTVLVENGQIVAVGTSDSLPVPAHAVRIDGRGKYLMPGLADMHAHLEHFDDPAYLMLFLVNGVKLQGVVTWFDNFCVLLRRDGHSQLVYKHAISTIMPGHPIQLFEGAEEPPAGDKV